MFRGPAAVFVVSWSAGTWVLNLPLAGSTGVAALLALAFSYVASSRPLNSAFARAGAGAGAGESEPRTAWGTVLRGEGLPAGLFPLRQGGSRSTGAGDAHTRVLRASEASEARPGRTRSPR
ncbi:MAG: hypothetical protein ABJC07_12510 [Acidobacteriota bacterium]